MDVRNKDKCKQCGQPDHGTAACNTVGDDRPVYNEAMDTIEKLKQALTEREKRIESIEKEWERKYNCMLEQAKKSYNACMDEYKRCANDLAECRRVANAEREQAEADNAELHHKLHLEMESSEHYSAKCYDLLCELDDAKREKEQAEALVKELTTKTINDFRDEQCSMCNKDISDLESRLASAREGLEGIVKWIDETTAYTEPQIRTIAKEALLTASRNRR